MPFPPVNPALARALEAREYHEPTPVQRAVLEAPADRDLLVSAQTGSGKTVAYGLALAPTLLGEEERLPRSDAPLALVIAPTRELAMQVHAELGWLYGPAGGRVVACVGGMDPRRERYALEAGCHIVVGTPGRLRDHLERGNLNLQRLRAVVLDEADEMLDLGFRDELEAILDATPPERRTLLFSATIPREIAQLAREYQRDAVRLDMGGRDEPHGDIEYRAVAVAPTDVERAVVNVLRYYDVRATLVFCSTREAVRRLHASLIERGFSAVALSGELSQAERSGALQALRDQRARVCVATDVAARGLDLPDLDLVVHADLPGSRETLLHRSGRTGRAGRKGTSVLVVPYTRRRQAERLLASARVNTGWSPPPSADAIRARDQERMLQDPVLTEEPTEDDLAPARAVLDGRGAEQVAAAFVRLYRARLPAPEDLIEAVPPAREARPPRAAPEREPRGAPRRDGDGSVWFRVNVGRRQNADPKWLLPLICRLGRVTRQDVGSIRIFEGDTRFEIAEGAAGRFMDAVRSAGEEEVRIEPASTDAPIRRRTNDGPPRPRRPKR